jgi:predicted negative regulator of RcsB-dependent stress response
MSTPNPDPAPTPAPVTDERQFTTELFGMELFWEQNKVLILSGAALVILLAVGIAGWFGYQSMREAEAREAFAAAGDLASWRAVAEDFPGSVVAGSARLLVGGALRDEGDMEASDAEFEMVLSARPPHPLAGVAELAIAGNARADGRTEEAGDLLVRAAEGDGFAAALALFLQAGEFSAKHDFNGAKNLLNELITRFPDSLPAQIAPGQLAEIDLVAPPADKEATAPVPQ